MMKHSGLCLWSVLNIYLLSGKADISFYLFICFSILDIFQACQLLAVAMAFVWSRIKFNESWSVILRILLNLKMYKLQM